MNSDIVECMHKTGLKKSQLARALGVTPGTVSHWANGRNRPSLTTLARLAELAGVPAAPLIERHIALQMQRQKKDAPA